MAYKRKTKDEYEIQGNYGYGDGWECISTECTRSEGIAQLKCYRENEKGIPLRMVTKRVKIEN